MKFAIEVLEERIAPDALGNAGNNNPPLNTNNPGNKGTGGQVSTGPDTNVGEPEPRDDYGRANGGGKLLDQIPASRLATRLELLRNTLRPTPHVQLAMKGMDLFAKLEYVNPVGSIKDRAAYWILTRAAERGEICEETTVIESSSGNFAAALAAFTHLVGLRFIPVIDPNISSTYESFLRRICPTVVKVEERDDTGGFLKARLEKVKQLCATILRASSTSISVTRINCSLAGRLELIR